jgi:polyhydroxyalkanoate synthesis regulator phasin
MATYQEQIAKLKATREQREGVEASFTRMAEHLADALMPLVDDGTITQDQAAKVMVAVTRGILKWGDKLP